MMVYLINEKPVQLVYVVRPTTLLHLKHAALASCLSQRIRESFNRLHYIGGLLEIGLDGDRATHIDASRSGYVITDHSRTQSITNCSVWLRVFNRTSYDLRYEYGANSRKGRCRFYVSTNRSQQILCYPTKVMSFVVCSKCNR